MQSYKIAFDRIPWESPREGILQKPTRAGDPRIRLVEYSREMPVHWCEQGHIGYVLQGEMEIRFEHGTERYAPGDGIRIPDGTRHKHAGRVLAETALVFLVDADSSGPFSPGEVNPKDGIMRLPGNRRI